MAKINEKIKYYRKFNNLTRGDLAHMVNDTAINIKRYEEGTLMPSLQRLKEISDVLNIDYRDQISIWGGFSYGE